MTDEEALAAKLKELHLILIDWGYKAGRLKAGQQIRLTAEIISPEVSQKHSIQTSEITPLKEKLANEN